LSHPLRWYKALKTQEGRREGGAFLVEGRRAISQIAKCCPESIREILVDDRPHHLGELPIAVSRVSAKTLQTIAAAQNPQGVLGVVHLPPETYSDSLPANAGRRVLLLEDVQDPGNIGTLVRGAAALGFDGVLMSEKCADPFSPKSVQASAGSVLSVWIRRSALWFAMARALKQSSFALIAADVSGKPLGRSVVKAPLVLLLGNEGRGLSAPSLRLADRVVRIPIEQSRAQSLNVASAGAVCMYVLGAGTGTIRLRDGDARAAEAL